MTSFKEKIREFLDDYGAALSSGDLPGMVDAWGVPAMVLNDAAVQPINEREEVESFFQNAIGQYEAQGLTSAQAEIEAAEKLGQNLFSADIRWSNKNENGEELSCELWRYIFKESQGGRLRIHVAVMKKSPAMPEVST